MPNSLLEVHNLSKGYRVGGKYFEAVRQVNLTLDKGEVLAFLGPNGAGKTTTIKTIAGLVEPNEGWVSIAGLNPHKNPQALRYLGAVLEGNRNLYWRLTPEENLEYFGVLKGLTRRQARRQGRELLARFELTEKRRTTVQMLSRGMQQKLAIATALIHQPKLLLLDEPTLGLDVEATQTVKVLVKEIAQEGCAILLTTHQLDIAEELSDRVAIIKTGEIIAEESTHELIRSFSGTAYIVETESNLDQYQQQILATLGGWQEGENRLHIHGTEELYKMLAALKPLPIVQVKKDSSDLTQVFLKLIQQNPKHD